MRLRVCLVTPFAWSQSHEVNEHVAASASALERHGHAVTIIAPSNRAADLALGRRSLRELSHGSPPPKGLLAIGPAFPISRRSLVGLPVGMRANVRLALTAGRFDVVHAHEPGLPSLSYLALRTADALTVATFHSPERLSHLPSRRQRERLLGRADALTATSEAAGEAAALRFPGDFLLLPIGLDPVLIPSETTPPRTVVIEWRPDERPATRAALRSLRELEQWRTVIMRTVPLSSRPSLPRWLRGRASTVTALDSAKRAEVYGRALAFMPAADGSTRARLEAQACGLHVLDPSAPGELGATLVGLSDEAAARRAESEQAHAVHGIDALGTVLDRTYSNLLGRRRPRGTADPLASRPWIFCDLHTHTEHSHDCASPIDELLDHAEALELGAIAITDHNVFSGAAAAVELARGRDLTVIPGEEMKTDEGEVIGLFLSHEIPQGMTMAETIAAIREQEGLVYLPHPFDRLHAIPRPETLRRLLAEIDIIEVYNARLLFDAYNDEALRFARKYNLLIGAGSDAHVLQGVGTGMVRMRAFRDPEEFVVSLQTVDIVRRPKSLLYLQSLKWAAQARERYVRTAAER
ncbi:MAG: glycosyltransferase [Actinomycetia bacterium]|nr:glycosyltransferase [Actinomycetes bacterium]